MSKLSNFLERNWYFLIPIGFIFSAFLFLYNLGEVGMGIISIFLIWIIFFIPLTIFVIAYRISHSIKYSIILALTIFVIAFLIILFLIYFYNF